MCSSVADALQCYTCESDECSEATLEMCSGGEVCSTRTTVFGDLGKSGLELSLFL